MRASRAFASNKPTTSNKYQEHNLPQQSDSDYSESDDNSYRRPKKKPKINHENDEKSTENEKKSTITEFTPEEEQTIIDYLIRNNVIPQALTPSIWKRIVADKVLPPHHTSPSLFAHFVGSLLARYKNYVKEESSRRQLKKLLREVEDNHDSSSEEYSDFIPPRSPSPLTYSSPTPSPPTSPRTLRSHTKPQVNGFLKRKKLRKWSSARKKSGKKVESPVESPRYLTVRLERLVLPETFDRRTPETGEGTPEAREETPDLEETMSNLRRLINSRNKRNVHLSSSTSSSSHEESLEAPVTPTKLSSKKSKKNSETLKKFSRFRTPESSSSSAMSSASPDCVKQEPLSRENSLTPPPASRRRYSEDEVVPETPPKRRKMMRAVLRSPQFPRLEIKRESSSDERERESEVSSLESRRFQQTHDENENYEDENDENDALKVQNDENDPLGDENDENDALEVQNDENDPLEDENRGNDPLEKGNDENNLLEDPGGNQDFLRSDKKITTRGRPGGRLLDVGSSSSSTDEAPSRSGRLSRTRGISRQLPGDSGVSGNLRETPEGSPDSFGDPFEVLGEPLESPGERLEPSPKPSQSLREPMDISSTPYEECVVIHSSDSEETVVVGEKSRESPDKSPGISKTPEKCKDASTSPIDEPSGGDSDDSLTLTTQSCKTGKSLKTHTSPVKISPAKPAPEKSKTPSKTFTAMNGSAKDDSKSSDIPVQFRRNRNSRRIIDSSEDSLPEVSRTHRVPPGKKRKLMTLDTISVSSGNTPDVPKKLKKKSAPSPANSPDRRTASTVNRNHGRHPVDVESPSRNRLKKSGVSRKAQYESPGEGSPEEITSPKTVQESRKVPVNVNSLVKNPFTRIAAPRRAPVRSNVSPVIREIREESPILINSSPEISNSPKKNPVTVKSPEKKLPKKTGNPGKVPVTQPAQKRPKFMDFSDSEDSDWDPAKHVDLQNGRGVGQGRNFPDAGASTSTGIRGHEFQRGDRGHLDHNDDDDSETEGQAPKGKFTLRQVPRLVLVPAGIEDEDEDEEDDGKIEAERRGRERKKGQAKATEKPVAKSSGNFRMRREYSVEDNRAMVQALCRWDCIERYFTLSTWKFLREKDPRLSTRSAKALLHHFERILRWSYQQYVNDPVMLERFRIIEEERQIRKEEREKYKREEMNLPE